jgi:UDP-D-galactose:(glucosyl)LPS alpha-1,6-D-galactosyltransferase
MVVASDWEGLSLSAVEALARGIPVISTPCDGIVEYLKHGVSGYMFKHDDMEGLANILNEIDDGALPGIDPKNCVKAVEMCESGRVYENFANKVEELMHLSESVPA